MNKKFLVAFGVMVAIIIFLVFYLFNSADQPLISPKPPKKLAQKPPTTPEPKDQPGPATALAPKPAPTPAPAGPPPAATQAPSPPPAAPPAASPEKPAAKPGAKEPEPPKTELQPLEPKEEHGLLVGKYRSYSSAGRKMEQLKKKGLPAFIRRDKGRYQVWVGPFATRQEAQKAAKTINKRRPPKVQKITIPVPK